MFDVLPVGPLEFLTITLGLFPTSLRHFMMGERAGLFTKSDHRRGGRVGSGVIEVIFVSSLQLELIICQH